MPVITISCRRFLADSTTPLRLIVALLVGFAAGGSSAEEQQLRVMTFNLCHGGDAGGQPLQQTIRVIREAKADIVGLQETHGKEVDQIRPDNGKKIADALGWHYFQQGDRTAILSRLPIQGHSQRKWGVSIALSDGRTLQFFNAHFAASPYQPYQLLEIPYGDAPFIETEAESIEWAKRARGRQVESLMSELSVAIDAGDTTVLTGDFNEPSHQDWTTRGQLAGRCPIKVEFPTTKRVCDCGLRDAFRLTHRDEVRFPGFTWTPTTTADDPKDRHDRIDYVFVAGRDVRVRDSQVVGEQKENAGIVVKPWPSDHRAVIADLVIDEVHESGRTTK